MGDKATNASAGASDELLRLEKVEVEFPAKRCNDKRALKGKSEYRATIVQCCIVILMGAPIHSAFMLFMLLPVFAIWIPYSVAVMVFMPQRRRIQRRKILIWAGVFASIAAVHWYYAYAARREADSIVAAIKIFSSRHKHCPASLDEIGIDRAQLTKRLGYSGYNCLEDGKPVLFYAATFIVFDTYHYDFVANSWVFHPD